MNQVKIFQQLFLNSSIQKNTNLKKKKFYFVKNIFKYKLNKLKTQKQKRIKSSYNTGNKVLDWI